MQNDWLSLSFINHVDRKNILLLSSLVTEAMNCKSILNYFGVSNTRCTIGLINRTHSCSQHHCIRLLSFRKASLNSSRISQRFGAESRHSNLIVLCLDSYSEIPLHLSVCLRGQIYATEKSKYKVCFILSRLFRLQIRLESLYCAVVFPRGATLVSFP